jgi:hypothetical protein
MVGTYSTRSKVNAVHAYRSLAWARVTNREQRLVRARDWKPRRYVELALRAMRTRYVS